MKGNYINNQKIEGNDIQIQDEQENDSNTGESSIKAESTVEYYDSVIPDDVIQKHLSEVPEQF